MPLRGRTDNWSVLSRWQECLDTEKRHSRKDKNAVNQTLRCYTSVIALFRWSTWWMSFALLTIINASKRSSRKVMFVHVSVTLSTGGEFNVTSCLIPCSIRRGMVPGGGGGMVSRRGVWSQRWSTVYRTPCYWHLVAVTEMGGMHLTGMYSCLSQCRYLLSEICYAQCVKL